MTILFCGGEPEDFSVSGTVTNVAPDTGSSSRRTTYARASVAVTPSGSTSIKAAFSSASAAFSATARMYFIGINSTSPFLWFSTGGNARLRLRTGGTSSPATLVLETYNGSSASTLATSVLTVAISTLYRVDIIVDYQASGRVRVYIDQTLYIDYSGDVTAASATTLDGLHMTAPHTTNIAHWSEIIVSTQDSRTLSLKTLVPDAAGTTNTFTGGAYTDIDEITASDTDVASSATAGQILQVNTTGMPSGWANLTVAAVKVVASAARGAVGPSKLALGVRTGGTDYYESPGTTLDTGYSAAVTKLYELNPVTTAAWTTTEIDALQLAFKTET